MYYPDTPQGVEDFCAAEGQPNAKAFKAIFTEGYVRGGGSRELVDLDWREWCRDAGLAHLVDEAA